MILEDNISSKYFTNTQYFREAALDFERNKKKGTPRYTLAPVKSKEWYEYWAEQKKRCLNGYKVGNMKVTGKHYYYMNFCRIKRTEAKGAKVAIKEEMFPAFWEVDYNWFWYKEIAWHGATKAQIEKLNLWKVPLANRDPYTGLVIPDSYGGGKHLSCLKTRRAGFSYKEAADGTYTYNFIPDSKCYYLAAKEPYLIEDGILNKVQVNLDWLNETTDGFWLKNRMHSGTLMHQRASYWDNNEKREKGYFSEIIGVTIAKDADKSRGKDGIKITFEEAGSFPELKAALDIIVPSVRDGSTVTGQISVFGTGGATKDKQQDIEGLDEIFNDPWTYDMLPFQNDWEDYESTECGVYIPCYMCNPTYIDHQGNIDKKAAIKDDDMEREKRRKSKDPKSLDRRIAEFSRTPSEALLRVEDNDFPVAEAKYQKNRILHDPAIKGLIKYGDLVRTATGVDFVVKSRNDARPLEKYPHKKTDDLDSCYTEMYGPEIDPTTGQAYANLYIITLDPFYDEDAEDTTSLFSFSVTKIRDGASPTAPLDVAWFAGRPRRLATCYDMLWKVADRYNCPVQSEIAGGGKGVLDSAIEKKKLHRCAFTPVQNTNKENKGQGKNRTYFMTMSTDDKSQGLTYYMNHLTDVVGLDEHGNELLNIHFVYNVALLDEIIKFTRKKNADRISQQIIKMYMLKEVRGKALKSPSKKRKRVIDRNNFGAKKRNDWNVMRLKGDEVVWD